MALLRGINVGGRNKIAMADLRAAFGEAGYSSVATYIQSGNVLFGSPTAADRIEAEVEAEVEAVLEARFGIPLVVVVRSHRGLRQVVEGAPAPFGAEPATFHYDVIFLKDELPAARAMQVVRLRDGVDRAWAGDGALYFSRLSARRTQSRMSTIVGSPEYKQMTVRNWNTTTRLLALLDA